MKTSYEEPTTLDAINNIHDSWDEVKILILAGIWKLMPTFTDDFEGFKTSVEEVTVMW